MRTDSKFFAERVLNDLLAEGMTPMKARIARDEVIRTAEAKNWPTLSHKARAKISRFSAEMQSIFVDDEGFAMLHTGIRREFQPIVEIQNFGQPRKAA